MMLAIAKGKNDRPLLLIGIDATNVERLKANKPILVDGTKHGLNYPGDICILYGDSLEDIARALRAGGLVDDDFVIRTLESLQALGMSKPKEGP